MIILNTTQDSLSRICEAIFSFLNKPLEALYEKRSVIFLNLQAMLTLYAGKVIVQFVQNVRYCTLSLRVNSFFHAGKSNLRNAP